jgi:hypothetical protein
MKKNPNWIAIDIPSTERRVIWKKLNAFVCLSVCGRSKKQKGQKNKNRNFIILL